MHARQSLKRAGVEVRIEFGLNVQTASRGRRLEHVSGRLGSR